VWYIFLQASKLSVSQSKKAEVQLKKKMLGFKTVDDLPAPIAFRLSSGPLSDIVAAKRSLER